MRANSLNFVCQVCVLALIGSIVSASPTCDNVLKTYEELGCKAVESSDTDICRAR